MGYSGYHSGNYRDRTAPVRADRFLCVGKRMATVQSAELLQGIFKHALAGYRSLLVQ